MSAELAGILNSRYFLAIIFAGAFGDAFLFTAAFVFGEIFFIAAGYGAAHLGDYKIIAVALAGAFAGDLCSYLIGKHYGERILRRISRKRPKLRLNFIRARALVRKRGAVAIIIARISGPISKIMPFCAGATDMKFKTFCLADLAGVLLGSAQFIIAGWMLAKGVSLWLG